MSDRHATHRGFGVAVTGALAGCVLGAASLVGFAPAASAAACSDVQVLFARGTGEPVGVGRVGQAFVDSLKGDLRGETVAVSAVNYPASDDFMQAVAGANDAAAQVQSIAASCPDTSIVLGGFSQGAAVVDLITADPAQAFGFGVPMSPEVANHVAAVAVFGNPSQKIGRPLVANSPLYGTKTIELCNGADPVCSSGDDRAAHSQYPQAGLTDQAASFAADRVKGHTPGAPVSEMAAGIAPR